MVFLTPLRLPGWGRQRGRPCNIAPADSACSQRRPDGGAVNAEVVADTDNGPAAGVEPFCLVDLAVSESLSAHGHALAVKVCGGRDTVDLEAGREFVHGGTGSVSVHQGGDLGAGEADRASGVEEHRNEKSRNRASGSDLSELCCVPRGRGDRRSAIGRRLWAVPVDFLTDDEAARFGRFDGVPARADLQRVFFLDDKDRTLVERRRDDHNRLGFALLLTTAR